jgi:nitrate reductase gamma subunit
MGILAYAALAIFFVGNVYRILRVATMPAHLRWELYPIPRGSAEERRRGSSYFEQSEWWTKPHQSARVQEMLFIAEEVLFQKSVWKHNRQLWLWSWLLHAGFYATTAAAASAALRSDVAAAIAWVAMPAGLLGILGIISLRATTAKLRPYTSRAAFANLALLGAFFASGTILLIGSRGAGVAAFAAALVRLSPVPALGVVAAMHVTIGCVFLAYFPFTQMTHAYMKFFAFHHVRWNDKPTALDPKMRKGIALNLRRPITWSAAHIAGASTWASAARTNNRRNRA